MLQPQIPSWRTGASTDMHRGRRPGGVGLCALSVSSQGTVMFLSSARKVAQASGAKRSTTPPAAWLSRTATPATPATAATPASLAVSTQCPLLMLYVLFRQPSLSPTGVLSPIYHPFVPVVKKADVMRGNCIAKRLVAQ